MSSLTLFSNKSSAAPNAARRGLLGVKAAWKLRSKSRYRMIQQHVRSWGLGWMALSVINIPKRAEHHFKISYTYTINLFLLGTAKSTIQVGLVGVYQTNKPLTRHRATAFPKWIKLTGNMGFGLLISAEWYIFLTIIYKHNILEISHADSSLIIRLHTCQKIDFVEYLQWMSLLAFV